MAPKKKPSPKQLAARAKFAAMAKARAAAAKKKKSTTGATKKTTSKKTTSSKIGISYYGDGKPVMARDLKIGQKYEWIMGAEYLEVKYIGPTSKHKTKKPGSKIGTGGYLFQFVKGGGYADMGSSAIFQYLRTIPAKITGATSRKKPATTSRKKPATTSRHTDTKSHNVKINVLSGMKKTKQIGKVPEPYDKDAVYEIKLYIENDGALYRQQTLPIYKNLTKKYKKGTFDVNKAAKLFRYLIDNGMKKYNKEFGSRGDQWHKLLNTTDRQYLAEWMADETKIELDAGNYWE